jgi:hypothetical protein
MKQLYIQLNALKKQIQSSNPIYLTQKDFDNGTYLMNQSWLLRVTRRYSI